MIQRLTSSRSAGAATLLKNAKDLAPKELASAASGFELPVMDVAKGLAIWSDLGSYQDYLQRFLKLYRTAVAAMHLHLQHGDRAAAFALAHKLAGVAANMALPQLFHCATEVERVLGSELDPEQALAQLDAALLLACVAIEELGCSTPFSQ